LRSRTNGARSDGAGLSRSGGHLRNVPFCVLAGEAAIVDEKLPNLTPAALGRLAAGMSTGEVEAVIGRFHRPNRYRGRPYYAWIGDGAMLRAFFDGPGGTLSKALLDVAEEHRVLDLRGDVRRRIKRCTINRVWSCISCRKSYRRSAVPAFVCPICHQQCQRVPPGIRVPTPKRVKAWNEFWTQYKAEKSLLDTYSRGELREKVKLEIFDIELKGKLRTKRRRRRTMRCT